MTPYTVGEAVKRKHKVKARPGVARWAKPDGSIPLLGTIVPPFRLKLRTLGGLWGATGQFNFRPPSSLPF
jgi:hypothetical protein